MAWFCYGLLPRGTTWGGTGQHRTTQGDKRCAKFARRGLPARIRPFH